MVRPRDDLLACGVRGLYAESEAVLGRGDVYTVVREGLGKTPAKLATFALLFDYVLLASINTLVAARLVLGLVSELGEMIHATVRINPPVSSALLAAMFCVYICRAHVVNFDRPAQELARSMPVATAVFFVLMAWVGITAALKEFSVPPLHSPNMRLDTEAFGWLTGTFWVQLPVVLIVVGLGHAMIARSGDDSLAEVNRVIATWKPRRFRGAVFAAVLNSFIFPAFVPFAAILIIPPPLREEYSRNIVGGIVHSLAGSQLMKLVTYIVVVFAGVSVLFYAASRAMAGARLSLEQATADGAMTDWFRHSHQRYGTPHRLLHLLLVMQLITLAASRGDVMELAKAYAFGIGWGFALKALAVAALRRRIPEARAWRIPLNIRIGRHELPLGLGLLAGALLVLACVNLLARERATICGLSFTALFFVAFQAAGRYSRASRSTWR